MDKSVSWERFIESERSSSYLQKLEHFIAEERANGKVIYPPLTDVFNAFYSTNFEQIKVVILGQDPYHGANQAHGLSFSVLPGVKTPPSLRNIYKELATDIEGFEIPDHGCLEKWATQGVLLLNTVLTVEEGKAHSHAKLGWETFTERAIEMINKQRNDVVFMLWGAHAHKKGQNIDRDRHYVLESVHPSPLSARRGFFGCRHFSLANEYLISKNQSPIDWQV